MKKQKTKKELPMIPEGTYVRDIQTVGELVNFLSQLPQKTPIAHTSTEEAVEEVMAIIANFESDIALDVSGHEVEEHFETWPREKRTILKMAKELEAQAQEVRVGSEMIGFLVNDKKAGRLYQLSLLTGKNPTCPGVYLSVGQIEHNNVVSSVFCIFEDEIIPCSAEQWVEEYC